MRIFTVLLLMLCFAFSATAVFAGDEEMATIYGYKFNDLNGNGIDDGEPRVSGITITLENLGETAVQLSDETDAQGRFRFTNLPVQDYLVCEVLPESTPPLIPTTPVCVTVVFGEKDFKEKVVFGNKELGEDEEEEIGCTRTQGYWGSSPAGQAELIALVPGTMLLGSVAYTAAQLDSILDAPVVGNALISLAHQLIAAKLNVLAGADDTGVSDTIASADALIAALVVPPVGSADVENSSPLGQSMNTLKDVLDEYNNGELGVPHCD